MYTIFDQFAFTPWTETDRLEILDYIHSRNEFRRTEGAYVAAQYLNYCHQLPDTVLKYVRTAPPLH